MGQDDDKNERLPEEDRQSGTRRPTPADYRSMGTRQSNTPKGTASREEKAGSGEDRPASSVDKPQAQAPKAAPRYTAQHTVVAGETLSHIALKYYGSAAKEHWMRIYEANRDAIGDDPNKIRVGQVLNIPE